MNQLNDRLGPFTAASEIDRTNQPGARVIDLAGLCSYRVA